MYFHKQKSLSFSREGGKKQGSISVEACLVVPVVLIVILPFVFLLRILVLQGILETSLQQIAQEVATTSYLVKGIGVVPKDVEEPYPYPINGKEEKQEELAGLGAKIQAFLGEADDSLLAEAVVDLAGAVLVKQMLMERIPEKDLKDLGVVEGWDSVSTEDTRIFYGQEGHGYLLRLSLSIDIKPLFSFWKIGELTISRTVRGFLGESEESAKHNPKEDLDSEELVYRIGTGIHYHQLSCYLIHKTVQTLSMEEAKQKGLSPCSRCGGGTTGTVYVSEGGGKYHAYGCEYLFPNLTELSKDEAIGLGLTSCGLCFGGKGELFH